MNTFRVLFLLFFVLNLNSFAQQKKYVSYTIKDGETIKSIAKDLDISTRDLLSLNPDIGKKPSAETVIIIPNKLYGSSTNLEEKVSVETADSDLYKVQPKETLYGISKKFGLSIAELIQLNPELVDGLKTGMELKTSFKETIKKGDDDDTDFVVHTVVKDNTIYNLTKKYNITEADLIKLNPALEEGLKLGMVLKIKKATGTPSKEISSKNQHVSDVAEVTIAKGATFRENIRSNKQIDVVFVLPYNVSKLDDLTNKGADFSKNSLPTIATDFHLGALLAIDSLKLKGIYINATFLDSENSLNKMIQVGKNPALASADVIIGPLFFDKAEWLSKHVKPTIITPFYSKNQDSYSANNLIKAGSKAEIAEDKLLSYLKTSYTNQNIILVNDGKAETLSRLWRIHNNLKTIPGVGEISVIKAEKGYISGGRITERMKATGKNWVFLITDDNVITASAMNNLKGLADKYDITLISSDKGKNFDTTDNNILGSLNFTYPSTEFYDMSSRNNKVFYEKYQVKNYAEPSDYAIKGFDVTYDALIRLASTEGSIESAFASGKSVRVASVFNYAKKTTGGFENKGVFIVQYSKDLSPIILP